MNQISPVGRAMITGKEVRGSKLDPGESIMLFLFLLLHLPHQGVGQGASKGGPPESVVQLDIIREAGRSH